MMTPLFPFIARSFLKKHPEQDSKDIGYYTGLLHSTYFLPSIVINPLMGYLSDRYGRRPILLIGLCGYGVGTLLLGLSSTYILALVSLFITGCFSGNTVVAKGMLGDLAKDENVRIPLPAPSFISFQRFLQFNTNTELFFIQFNTNTEQYF
jgi:MFS family permease